ncbi:MAG: MarR family winged helix-turn-helix transcriptional regulator [Janthinobacterium lividum]
MSEDEEARFGFLITDVGRLTGRLFDQIASKTMQLTRAQCRVLVYLSINGGINQARLAEMLDITPIALARLLDRMADNDWIRRVNDADDRRMHRLWLTDKAKGALRQARAVGDRIRAEALADLSSEEGEVLTALLQRVRATLSDSLGNAHARDAAASVTQLALKQRSARASVKGVRPSTKAPAAPIKALPAVRRKART